MHVVALYYLLLCESLIFSQWKVYIKISISETLFIPPLPSFITEDCEPLSVTSEHTQRSGGGQTKVLMFLSLCLSLGWTALTAGMVDTVTFYIIFILSYICLICAHNRLYLKTRNIRNPMMKYKIIKSKNVVRLPSYFKITFTNL